MILKTGVLSPYHKRFTPGICIIYLAHNSLTCNSPVHALTSQNLIKTSLSFNSHESSTNCNSSLEQFKDLQITLCPVSQRKPKPVEELPVISKYYTDHMLQINWSQLDGWSKPEIKPFQNLSIHPAAKVLHYAASVNFRPKTHQRF